MEYIGYARVSTAHQHTDSQCDMLQKAGCKKIFIDIETGKKFIGTQLQCALDYVREGDTFVVTDIDRLRRNTFGFHSFIHELKERSVEFKSLNQPSCDTTTANGKFMAGQYALFAELEGSLASERTKRGLKAARERGRLGGRPKAFTPESLEIAKILRTERNLTHREIGEYLGIPRSTVHKHLSLNGIS